MLHSPFSSLCPPEGSFFEDFFSFCGFFSPSTLYFECKRRGTNQTKTGLFLLLCPDLSSQMPPPPAPPVSPAPFFGRFFWDVTPNSVFPTPESYIFLLSFCSFLSSFCASARVFLTRFRRFVFGFSFFFFLALGRSECCRRCRVSVVLTPVSYSLLVRLGATSLTDISLRQFVFEPGVLPFVRRPQAPLCEPAEASALEGLTRYLPRCFRVPQVTVTGSRRFSTYFCAFFDGLQTESLPWWVSR